MLAAIDAGAEDIVDDGELWRVVTPPTDLHLVRSAIEEAGDQVGLDSADLTMVAANLVPITDLGDAKQIFAVIDALEDLDDVQDVFANFDISDEIADALEAE